MEADMQLDLGNNQLIGFLDSSKPGFSLWVEHDNLDHTMVHLTPMKAVELAHALTTAIALMDPQDVRETVKK